MPYFVFQGKVFKRTAITRKEQLWKTVSTKTRELYDLSVGDSGNGMADYARKEQAIEVTKDLRKALRELGIW